MNIKSPSNLYRYGISGFRVLITRPQHQTGTLVAALKNREAIPVLLPVITIFPRGDDPSMINALTVYDKADYFIFTSVNAVEQAKQAIMAAEKPWPPIQTVFAVGSATRNRLYEEGFTHVVIPEGEFCSESLLLKMSRYPINRKLILIFGGANPRKLLETTLSDQGAKVLHAICYERKLNPIEMNFAEQKALLDNIDIILLTSNEIMTNFIAVFDKKLYNMLFDKPFLIIHKRMQAALKNAGYMKSPIIADNPTDNGIITALTHWYEEYRHG